MAALSGLITTYSSLNYTGELFQLSPVDAPFLSMAGGLTGGMQTTATQFEWETEDLRTPVANNVQLEGADAPSGEGRSRSNVTNVCEIHMATVDVSFTKLAAYGQKSGINIDAANPVVDEFSHQLSNVITSKKQDIELSFLTGAYNLPSDNTTARKTRGIIPAITTNKDDIGGAALSATTATNGTFSVTGSGLANGNTVIITSPTNTELTNDTAYFVVSFAAGTPDTFKISATKGGAPITFAATGTATVQKGTDLTEGAVGDLLQKVFDNGGLTETPNFTLWCGSWNKRQLSDIYIKAFGSGYFQTSRTVGGVSVDTITTDFGTLNVAVNRWMPKHKLLFASMQEVSPVFLNVPDYGHFFVKPLPSNGAYEKAMLYGEIGLAYGAEKHHGLIVNTSIG